MCVGDGGEGAGGPWGLPVISLKTSSAVGSSRFCLSCLHSGFDIMICTSHRPRFTVPSLRPLRLRLESNAPAAALGSDPGQAVAAEEAQGSLRWTQGDTVARTASSMDEDSSAWHQPVL